MHVPHPYESEAVVIDETSPPKASDLKPPVRALSIVPCQFDERRRLDSKGVDALVGHLDGPDQLRAITIDYDSKLRRLPPLERFINLEYFHVLGRQIAAYSDLTSFPHLKSVFLCAQKSTQLQLSKHTRLQDFRAIRGHIDIIDFNADNHLLQACAKLTSFAHVQSKQIWLDSCHHLQLDSLCRVQGLERLHILGRNTLGSLDFVAGCDHLLELSVTATRLSSIDFGGLNAAPKLARVFLGCSDALLRRASAVAPKLIFTNGDLTLIDSQEVEYSDYEAEGAPAAPVRK